MLAAPPPMGTSRQLVALARESIIQAVEWLL